jgi:signal transduction histidine kinase
MPARADPERYWGTLGLVWAVATALLVMTWWLIGSQVATHRDREMQAAGRDLANLTRVSQEHADRTLHSADQVIRFVQARYLELGSRLDLIGLTQQGIIDAENFPQVGVIDAQGIYILANRPITTRLDLSDREHFAVHRDKPSDQLFVSKPVLGRATGKWSIQLTRRIELPGGGFGGVVVLSIDPGYFARFYSDLRLGPQGVSTVIGLDGVIRARHPSNDGAFSADMSGSPLMKRIAAGEPMGAYTSRSPVDGVERMLHFRRLARFNLVVVSGLGLDDLLANHHRTRDALVLQGGVVSLLILILAALLTGYLARMRRELQARHQAQLQAQESTEQLKAIFALSPDGFVGFDAGGRLKQVNPAFLRLTAAEGIELEGLDETQFGTWLSARCEPGATFDRVAALQGRAGVPASPAQRTLVIARGKKVLQVGFGSSDARTLARVLVFRDVTHETAVDQIKSEFLAAAAHELRTPMASVYGFAEVLSTQNLSEAERREFVNIILEQSGNVSRILDELLDLARMEARRGKDFKRVPLDLAALVRDTARVYKPPAGRQAPSLEAAPRPMRVQADADKLRQAVLNVLSNAYKYSPGGGAVAVHFLSRTSGSTPQVGVCIGDQGIGMSPAQVAQVFERFYRVDQSGQVPGTGLGMSLVKEIIDLHQGEVEIASALGQGTRVCLWLPQEGP